MYLTEIFDLKLVKGSRGIICDALHFEFKCMIILNLSLNVKKIYSNKFMFPYI